MPFDDLWKHTAPETGRQMVPRMPPARNREPSCLLRVLDLCSTFGFAITNPVRGRIGFRNAFEGSAFTSVPFSRPIATVQGGKCRRGLETTPA